MGTAKNTIKSIQTGKGTQAQTTFASNGSSANSVLKNTATNTLSNILNSMSTPKQAAANANGISALAQAMQYAYNTSGAQMANDYSTSSLEAQMAYNEAMMEASQTYNAEEAEKARQFSSAEAQKTRDWTTQMSNTAYQRTIEDMKSAGINPILAASLGSTGYSSGATAQTSQASSGMASAGALSGQGGSASNYTGQMEYMNGTLALMAIAMSTFGTIIENIFGKDNSAKSTTNSWLDNVKENFKIGTNASKRAGYNTERTRSGYIKNNGIKW